MATKQQKVI